MKSLPLLLVVWLLLCLAVMQMLVWQLHLWQPTVRWFHSCGIAQLGETLEFVGAKKSRNGGGGSLLSFHISDALCELMRETLSDYSVMQKPGHELRPTHYVGVHKTRNRPSGYW